MVHKIERDEEKLPKNREELEEERKKMMEGLSGSSEDE